MRSLITRAVAAAQEKKAAGIQIWVAGDVSWNLQTFAKQSNINIRRNILKDPMFRVQPAE